jgi:adenine-specific DNA-methyltransferase
MANLAKFPTDGTVRILDPGAGIGVLALAVVERILTERRDLSIEVDVFEIDEALLPELESTLQSCESLAEQVGSVFLARIHSEDFIEWASIAANSLLLNGLAPRFDLVIMNPPYRKIHAQSGERRAMRRIGVEVSNLYAAFLALGIALLDNGGQLIAITPRSFANGPYFRSFRRYFLSRAHFERIHVFESRARAFSDDEVLQENIIFRAAEGPAISSSRATISSNLGPEEPVSTRSIQHFELVDPEDEEAVLHVVCSEDDARVARAMARVTWRLTDLGVEVSTGRVVDFRARSYLRDRPVVETAPLIYPGHLRGGSVAWPMADQKKPSAIVRCPDTESLLLPNGTYVLVNRFTAKEEKRRVRATVFDPSSCPGEVVAFENHLNVFHYQEHGLDVDFAHGLAAWLNSTLVDQFVRLFSGHTQINANDLRRLPYPSRTEILELGTAARAEAPADQPELDILVARHVKELRGLAA